MAAYVLKFVACYFLRIFKLCISPELGDKKIYMGDKPELIIIET